MAKWKPPGADPFTPDERTAIPRLVPAQAFRAPSRTRLHADAARAAPRVPCLRAYAFLDRSPTLRSCRTPVGRPRPQERAAARQRSRHLYKDGAPKTASADRWVELFPETVRVLRVLEPLHVMPETPVFTTTEDRPIEPKAFASRHWYRALRALGLRMRGIYATRDTFVTTALQAGVKVAWLEAQTGVAYATPNGHYGKWIAPAGEGEVDRFAKLEPTLFSCEEGVEEGRGDSQGGQCAANVATSRGSPNARRGT